MSHHTSFAQCGFSTQNNNIVVNDVTLHLKKKGKIVVSVAMTSINLAQPAFTDKSTIETPE